MKYTFRHMYEVEYIDVYAATPELAREELGRILGKRELADNYELTTNEATGRD